MNYKKASKLKLRFETSRGNLSVEQLWELSLVELDKLTLLTQKAYKESGSESFLTKSTAKNKTLKLKFDILLDVLTSKVEERDALQSEGEVKAHNNRIDELIAKKQDEEIEGLSIKELEKLRK